ncbi:MAG: DUF2227 family putative metal-binding protein [Chlamydiales bacterium]
MANYRTHTAFNVIITLPLLCGALYFFLSPKLFLFLTFVGAYLYTTFFMNPDLDIAHKIKPFSLRGILALPFRGYAKLFKHRGISHSFLFGSLTRVIWLTALLFLLFYFILPISLNKKDLIVFCHQYKSYLVYGLGGICCADWSHLIVDYFS